MKRFEVKVTNGKYNAPSIYLEAARDVEAEKLAKSKSGLGRFDSWQFIAREIK